MGKSSIVSSSTVKAVMVLFSIAIAAGARAVDYTTDPVTGGRIFRFDSPADEDFTTVFTTWANNMSGYWRSGDIFEFVESDDPYVFTRNANISTVAKLAPLTFRGVKSDGSPADPDKVVFQWETVGKYGWQFDSNSNRVENITFNNMWIKPNSACNTFSNCVFRGYSTTSDYSAIMSANNTSSEMLALDCLFTDNTNSRPVVGKICSFVATNCVFSENVNTATTQGGAAIGVNALNVTCSGCSFEGNHTTGFFGGAIYIGTAGTIAIDGCMFRSNSVYRTSSNNNYGGGGAIAIHNVDVPGHIRNCLFDGNSIDTASTSMENWGGGAIYLRGVSSGIAIENCTFVGNSVAYSKANNKDFGGAVYAYNGTVCGITNCIFYANHTTMSNLSSYVNWKYANMYVLDWSLVANCLEANFEYNDTTYDFSSIDTDGTPSTHICNGVNGNLVGDYDPKFTDAANGDYTLQKGSPCRDAGTFLAWMTDGSLDLGGNARVFGSAPDMGCYEWWQKSGLSIFVR